MTIYCRRRPKSRTSGVTLYFCWCWVRFDKFTFTRRTISKSGDLGMEPPVQRWVDNLYIYQALGLRDRQHAKARIELLKPALFLAGLRLLSVGQKSEHRKHSEDSTCQECSRRTESAPKRTRN